MRDVFINYIEQRDEIGTRQFLELLSLIPTGDVRDSITRLRRPPDRQNALFGKLMLRHFFNQHGEHGDPLLKLRLGPYRKPFIEDAGFSFNISHSGNVAVCAFYAEAPIGIDIEKVSDIDVREFAEHFDPDDVNLMQKPGQLRFFYQRWTQKEAVLKGHGTGLLTPLIQVNTSGTVATIEDEKWFLQEISINEDYVCHVAVPHEQFKIHVNKSTIQDFLN